MRNLVLLEDVFQQCAITAPVLGDVPATLIAPDNVDGSLYVASSGSTFSCHRPPHVQVTPPHVRCAWSLMHFRLDCGVAAQAAWTVDLASSLAGGTGGRITSMAHVPELEAVFVALDTGQLCLILTKTRSVEEVCHACMAQGLHHWQQDFASPATRYGALPMQVGELAGGVAAAEWSPDSELLSLVSVHGQLLLMNKVRCWLCLHVHDTKEPPPTAACGQPALLLARTGR